MGQGLDLQLRSTSVAAIRVLVVDDHVVFSDALATILRTESDIEVVGKGGTVREAIDAARALQPDVVLLDVHMPDGSGIEAIRAARRIRPAAAVLVATVFSDEDNVVSAICAGAGGYNEGVNAPSLLRTGVAVVGG